MVAIFKISLVKETQGCNTFVISYLMTLLKLAAFISNIVKNIRDYFVQRKVIKRLSDDNYTVLQS